MSQLNVTIKDVAKRANVSTATVSRVLNSLDRVSGSTRKKVLKAVEELRYVPNAMAASMVTKQSHMIAVIVPNIQNAFYTAVIQATADVAKREGYFTFVFPTNDSELEEASFFAGFCGQYADGFVMVGAHTDPRFYRRIPKPAVLVDRFVEDSGIDGVVIDNFRGAYEAIRHMIELGHRRIAIITGQSRHSNWRERYWGYQQALKDYGIDADPAYCRQGNWQEDTGYQATVELIRLEKPPTAIFAASHLFCKGVIWALRDLKLKIGEDMSLVGFDEHDLAAFTEPKVSIVRRPTYEVGTQASQLLIRKIKSKDTVNREPKKITLGVELVKNGSVKPLL